MRPRICLALVLLLAVAIAACRGAVDGSDPTVAPNHGSADVSLQSAEHAFPVDCSEWPESADTTSAKYSVADRHWLQFRGDRALTGRSSVGGNGNCLQVFATADFSRRLSWVVAEIDDSAASIDLGLPVDDLGPFNAFSLLDIEPNYMSVITNQFAQGQRPLGARFGDLTDAYDGPERLQCDDISNDFNHADIETYGSCALSSHDGTGWVERWRTTLPTLEGDAFSAAFALGDFDNDGRQDVAIRTWFGFQLLVLDTGERWGEGLFTPFPQHPINYATGPDYPDCGPGVPEPCFVPWDERPQPTSSGRGYGWFGGHDIDSDGLGEFIVMGVAEQFISVLDWVDGELTETWQHTFEELYHPKEWITQHTPPRIPVLDLDGDGSMEIVTNIYNENADGLWHVLVFDAVSGDIELDIPAAYVVDSIVLAIGEPPALFIAQGVGAAVEAPGLLRLSKFHDGTLRDVWSSNGSNLETRSLLEFPPNSDADGNLNPVLQFVGSNAEGATPATFVTRSNAGLDVWSALTGSPAIERIASISTPGARAVGSDTRGGRLRLLLEVDHQEGTRITAEGLRLQVGASRSQPPPISSPITTTHTDGSTIVVVQTSMNEMTSFLVRPETRGLTPFATYAGRGMWNYLAFGANEVSQLMEVPALEGALLADLDGDGMHELVAAVPGGVAAYRLDGTTYWLSDLGVPGGIGFGDRPHVAFWFAGRFTEPDRDDVAVFIARGRRAELRLLDGRDGGEIWRLENGPVTCQATPQWGAATGAGWDAVADIDGDGLDELLLTPFREFLAISMDDLSFPIARQAYGCDTTGTDVFPVHPTSLPVPVPVVVDTPEGSLILYSRHPQLLGLTDLAGGLIWHRVWHPGIPSEEQQHRAVMQGVGDIDGNGTLEVIATGYCDGGDELRVFDLASGESLWSLPAPETCLGQETRASVTADFDGDGRDEALLTTGGTLRVIDLDTRSNLLRTAWQADYNSGTFSTPSVSALDQSGTVTIFTATGDGRLVAFSAPGPN